MRRIFKWALLLAVTLLVLSAYHGLNRWDAPAYPAGEGCAALGMMLLDAEEGVYVLAVSDQSPAHLAGLEPGDYILRANGQAVTDTTALDELLGMDNEHLQVVIRRKGQEMQVTLSRR